jgi:hypothetical protein
VVSLFSSKPAVLAGWTHYIAFDLFVGRYIVADNSSAGILNPKPQTLNRKP